MGSFFQLMLLLEPSPQESGVSVCIVIGLWDLRPRDLASIPDKTVSPARSEWLWHCTVYPLSNGGSFPE
jgi:hypothetical protein